MCCHVFEDNDFVLMLLTEKGRAGAENKNLFSVSKDLNGFLMLIKNTLSIITNFTIRLNLNNFIQTL